MDKKNRSLRDIAELASQRLGGVRGRALDREAKRRGLTLSYTTVDKILAGTYTSRPTKATLQALSEISGVPLEEVYQAAGVALPMKPLADQLPPDVDILNADQRRVVIDLARQFVKQNKREHKLLKQLEGMDQSDKPEQRSPKYNASQLRAMEAEDNARPKQKTGPADLGVTELFGEEARNYPVPPIEQMAAHPYFKTKREKWEEAYGERGEENQDPGGFDE